MFPTTDQGRIDQLQRIITLTRVDRQHGEPVNSEAYLKAMAYYGALSGACQLVRDAEHRLARHRLPFLDQLDLLIRTCRDFWDGWQRKARRHKQPESLHFFHEPGQNPLPVTRKASSWTGFARRLIEGDQAAYEAGYPRAQQPDATELSAILEKLLSLEQPYHQARLALRDARKTLLGTREYADRVLRFHAHMLRWSYRDVLARERALRRYGYRQKVPIEAKWASRVESEEPSGKPAENAATPNTWPRTTGALVHGPVMQHLWSDDTEGIPYSWHRASIDIHPRARAP